MKTTLLTLAVLLLPVVAWAEEAAPKPAGYQLKKRSSFSVAEDTRAPFWPIGWNRRAQEAAAAIAAKPVVVKATIDPANFKITSILLGSPSLAVINGRAYGEGEFIKTPRPAEGAPADPAATPRIRVQQISDSAVVLQSGAQQVTVKFNRQGLALKSRTPEVLLQDR